MKLVKSISLFIFFGLLVLNQLLAQSITVKGVVKDKETGETVPMIIVDVPDTDIKVQTDFDGVFTLTLPKPYPTIRATCIGFKDGIIPITAEKVQEVEILLESSDVLMNEVVIVAPENPAYRIMRKVVENKPKNDYRNLEAYQYEFYVKTQLDVDNISDEFKQRKITKKLGETLEESSTVVNEMGKEVVPVFISESISDFYYKKNPEALREYIKASRVKGVGVEDESFISQFMGATFIQFNFYENSLIVVDKPFISPIADGWRANYHYVLEDSVIIDGKKCYELDIKPKREQDLAFWGRIWIEDSTFALKKIDVNITKDANLNFVDDVKIKKDWKRTAEGPYFENFTDVFIDLSDIRKNAPGMIVKFHSEISDLVINEPKEKKFYEIILEVADDANDKDDAYWDTNRKNKLSDLDVKSSMLIDSLKNAPVVKTYVDVIDFVIYGYKKFNKIEIGPYIQTYAYNNVEGHRFRLGFRTNVNFSKKIELRGYLAYGTKDERFKYIGGFRYIPNKKKWTEFGFNIKYELERLGITDQSISYYYSIFSTLNRWGRMTGAYYNRVNEVFGIRQLNKNFSARLGFRTWEFDPVFNFAYYDQYPNKTSVATHIKTAEVVLSGHYAKNERFALSGNNRYSLGATNGPEIDLQYIFGTKSIYGQYEYHKIDLLLTQKVFLSTFGTSTFKLGAGKVKNTVPYPLLKVQFGNQYLVYNQQAYNMMNFFEFVADQYTSLQYEHQFNGFFFNRVPLLTKLKWREVVNFNAVLGSVQNKNLLVVPEGYSTFIPFNNQPYMEVGYGIENIFKFIRIEMFHRLTYLERPNTDKWGIKIGFLFRL